MLHLSLCWCVSSLQCGGYWGSAERGPCGWATGGPGSHWDPGARPVWLWLVSGQQAVSLHRLCGHRQLCPHRDHQERHQVRVTSPLKQQHYLSSEDLLSTYPLFSNAHPWELPSKVTIFYCWQVSSSTDTVIIKGAFHPKKTVLIYFAQSHSYLKTVTVLHTVVWFAGHWELMSWTLSSCNVIWWCWILVLG